MVRREMVALPDDLRQPLLLRFYGELEYPQIAQQLRVSEQAVRKRVSRGVDRLRQRLAGAGALLSAMQVDQTSLLGSRGERGEDLLGDAIPRCGRLARVEPAPKSNVEVALGGHAITCAVGNSSSRSSDSRIARVA